MKKNITRENIAEYINLEFGLSKKDCYDMVEGIINNIISGLNKDKILKIHNFGTFKIKNKKSRVGRNPKTKEEFIISDRRVVSFKPSKSILKYMNRKNSDQ